MTKRFIFACLGLCLLLFTPTDCSAQIRESDDVLARQVFKQLLSVVPEQQRLPWPPELILVDKGEINAYASIEKKDAQIRPVVVCYNGLLQKVGAGNADRLAF